MNETDFRDIQLLLQQRALHVRAARYEAQDFGSWLIEVAGPAPLRIVWDGKDAWLALQRKGEHFLDGGDEWNDVVVETCRARHTPEWIVNAVLAITGRA